MEGLALALLIATGVGGLWDLLDPGALEVKFNSGARATFAFASSIASIVLALLVLHAAPIVYVIMFSVMLCLVCVKVAIDA